MPNTPQFLTDHTDLIALRDHIFEHGLNGKLFSALNAHSETIFQDIFGENILLQVEFDVALIGEHSHFVYIPRKGCAPQSITSFPENGALKLRFDEIWQQSPHAPTRKSGKTQRIKIIEHENPAAAWKAMRETASRINGANLNYNFLFQNSNSVAATLCDVAGRKFEDLKGGAFNFGASNLLWDELATGHQVPRFLFRGGTSWIGKNTWQIGPKHTSLDTDA